jgi:hypothetical protein
VADNVSSKYLLEARILELEGLQAQQMTELKTSAVNIVGSISPSSLLKEAIKNITSFPEIKTKVIDTVIGIGTGFLGRKLYVGGSRNIFKKMAGSAVQLFVTNFVRRKMPAIRETIHEKMQED